MDITENFYLVQLKPFSEDLRKKSEIVQKFQQSVINSKVCGMGWADNMSNDDYIELKKYGVEKYKNVYMQKNFAGKEFKGNNSFVTALNIYAEMKPGDYIFTRLDNSMCYIGKIESKAYNSREKLLSIGDNADKMSWFVDVNWKEVDSELNMHGVLRGLLERRFNTAQRIKLDTAKQLIKKIYEGNEEPILIDVNNYCQCLDSRELEDLVGFYIQDTEKGYKFVPSSCKNSTKKYEFKLSNGDKSIVAQVKNQKGICVADYESDKNFFEKIYLFSGIEEYSEEAKDNVIIINKHELFDYFRSDFESKGYFYNILNGRNQRALYKINKEHTMKSTLIKDTTKSERIQLIKEWEETEGCESSGIDLMTYFKDYIDGVKEISEVNAAFNARYVSEIPDNDSSMSCGMGMRR